MKTELDVAYVITCDSAELRLIMSGLRGTLKEEDKISALKLQEKILEDRFNELKNRFTEAEKNWLNVQKSKE